MKTFATTEPSYKLLTTKDVALGIGRKFAGNELAEYLTRTAGGKPKTASQTKQDLISRLSKNLSK